MPNKIIVLILAIFMSMDLSIRAAAPKTTIRFEDLPSFEQAEIAKKLSDKELAQLASALGGLPGIKAEMKNRPAFYWQMPLEQIALDGHTAQVYSLEFSHDDSLLVSGSDDKTVRIWDVKNYTEIKRIGGPIIVSSWLGDYEKAAPFSDDYAEAALTVALSPDNKKVAAKVAASDYNSVVRLWNSVTGDLIKQFRNEGYSPLAFSHDSKLFAFIPKYGYVMISGQESDKEIDIAARLEKIVFSKDNKFLIGFNASIEWFVSTLNITTEQVSKVLLKDAPFPGHVNSLDKRDPYRQGPLAIAFSPDITILALVAKAGTNRDSLIILWNTKTGEKIREMKDQGYVTSVAFSHDGSILASGKVDGTVTIWYVKTGKKINTFKEQEGGISLSFSPDDKTLAIGCQDGTIQLVSAEN